MTAITASQGKQLISNRFPELFVPNANKGRWHATQKLDTTTTHVQVEFFERAIEVMKKAITALKRNLDYNAYYNAFLLDQITEREFEQLSEEYAVSFNQKCTDSIKSEIELLLKLTGEKFTPSEIANIFHVDETEAERVLENMNLTI